MVENDAVSSEDQMPKSIAIISGKGGSGKTMIAALMGKIFSDHGIRTTLVDADIATGGLTFYLGLKMVENISQGLSNILLSSDPDETGPVKTISTKVVQAVRDEKLLSFVGIGDIRRLFKHQKELNFQNALEKLFASEDHASEVFIVDCRGGIDDDSLDVCRSVEEIVIVVETDTTSYQATQHLVEILSANNLAEKLKGFIINKAFDDPSATARNGTGAFRTQYLGAVPFDLTTTRKFLVGEIPKPKSVFGVQVWAALRKAYGYPIEPPQRRVLDFKDYQNITLTNLDSTRGGVILGSVIAAMLVILLTDSFFGSNILNANTLSPLKYALVIGMLGLAAAIEPIRRAFGLVITAYVDLFKRLAGKFS